MLSGPDICSSNASKEVSWRMLASLVSVHLYADGGIVLGIEISDPVPAMTCVMYEITKNSLKLELIGIKEERNRRGREGEGGRVCG
jgi:hypothetical protein